MAIYIVKNGVWNGSQKMWDSFQTSVFNAKNLPFVIYRTLHVRAGLDLRTCALWPCAQVEDFLDFTS